MDDGLDLVRRGFDPGQVQQLVGQLAAELRALATENEHLRAALAERGPAPPTGASAGSATMSGSDPADRIGGNAAETPGDVFAEWSRETEELMRAAQARIAVVTERATAQAAAAIAAAETAAQAIRGRAQRDADAIVADARRRAERDGQVAAAEQSARLAEARAAVERANADLVAARAELDEVRARRAAVSRQLGNARTLLLQLLDLVDDDPTASSTGPVDAADSGRTTLQAARPDEQH